MILASGPIYEEGIEAYTQGYDESENPYTVGTNAFDMWSMGWEDQRQNEADYEEC